MAKHKRMIDLNFKLELLLDEWQRTNVLLAEIRDELNFLNGLVENKRLAG